MISFDRIARVYRNLTDGVRTISQRAVTKLRDAVADRRSDAPTLAADLTTGRIDVDEWEQRAWRAVQRRHVAQYILGRGGREQMTDDDVRRLESHLAGQRSYLRGFAEDVRAGTLSEAQVASRLALYESASVQAFGIGQASAWDVILPAYPGDGGTDCRSRCRCMWTIRRSGDDVIANWITSPGEICDDCRDRAARYNPLIIPMPEAA